MRLLGIITEALGIMYEATIDHDVPSDLQDRMSELAGKIMIVLAKDGMATVKHRKS